MVHRSGSTLNITPRNLSESEKDDKYCAAAAATAKKTTPTSSPAKTSPPNATTDKKNIASTSSSSSSSTQTSKSKEILHRLDLTETRQSKNEKTPTKSLPSSTAVATGTGTVTTSVKLSPDNTTTPIRRGRSHSLVTSTTLTAQINRKKTPIKSLEKLVPPQQTTKNRKDSIDRELNIGGHHHHTHVNDKETSSSCSSLSSSTTTNSSINSNSPSSSSGMKIRPGLRSNSLENNCTNRRTPDKLITAQLINQSIATPATSLQLLTPKKNVNNKKVKKSIKITEQTTSQKTSTDGNGNRNVDCGGSIGGNKIQNLKKCQSMESIFDIACRNPRKPDLHNEQRRTDDLIIEKLPKFKLTCSVPLERISGILDTINNSNNNNNNNKSSTLNLDKTEKNLPITEYSTKVQQPVDLDDDEEEEEDNDDDDDDSEDDDDEDCEKNSHNSVSSSNVESTVASNFNNNQNKSLCLYCDKKFSSQKIRITHTERVHKVVAKCRRISSRTSLSSTSNLTLSDAAVQLHPGCSYCCKNNSNINSQNSTTTTNSNSNNKVKFGQQKFTISNDLKSLFHHMCDYHSDKYFACKECAIRFQNVDLINHHNELFHHKLAAIPSSTSFTSSTFSVASKNRLTRSTTTGGGNNNKLIDEINQPLRIDINDLKKNHQNNIEGIEENSLSYEGDNSNSNSNTKTRRQFKQAAMENNRSNSVSSNATTTSSSTLLTRSAASLLQQNNVVYCSGEETTILSRLGVAQNRLPRGKKGTLRSRVTRTTITETTKVEPLPQTTIKTRSKVGFCKLTSNEPPISLLPSSDTVLPPRLSINNRIEPLCCTFDDDFYEKVSVNVRNNLNCHIDGKLDSTATTPCPLSPVLIIPTIRSTLIKGPLLVAADSEIHEATSLTANTAFPTLLTAEQFGSDLTSTTKIKRPITRHSWKWKWDSVKKYKFVNEGGKFVKKIKQPVTGLRDLSKLDMWTQLTMRSKHELKQKELSVLEQQDDSSILNQPQIDVVSEHVKEAKRKQIEQLNMILDHRRLPQITLEQCEQTIVKFEQPTTQLIAESTPPTLTETILSISYSNNAAGKDETDTAKLNRTDNNNEDENDFAKSLNLFKTQRQQNHKNDDIILSGEWARPRCYICYGCGAKFDKLKALEEHKMFRHPYVYSTHYEIVGRELMEGDLYKHFYIPTKALNRLRNKKEPEARCSSSIKSLIKFEDTGKISVATPTSTCGEDESMDSVHSISNLSSSVASKSDCDTDSKATTITAASRSTSTFISTRSSTATNAAEDNTSNIIVSASSSTYHTQTEDYLRNCSKCKRECGGLLELYRHMLDCSGDYAWILAKKRKYRYFGTKRRRHAKHLNTSEKKKKSSNSSTEDTPKQKYCYNPSAPRPPRPSDAESIRRMLENLPAKRSCRQILPDATKKPSNNKKLSIQQSLKKKSVLVKSTTNKSIVKGKIVPTTVSAISKNILRNRKKQILTRHLRDINRNNTQRQKIKTISSEKSSSSTDDKSDKLNKNSSTMKSELKNDDDTTKLSDNFSKKTKRFVRKITQKLQPKKKSFLIKKVTRSSSSSNAATTLADSFESTTDISSKSQKKNNGLSSVTKKRIPERDLQVKEQKLSKTSKLLKKLSFRKKQSESPTELNKTMEDDVSKRKVSENTESSAKLQEKEENKQEEKNDEPLKSNKTEKVRKIKKIFTRFSAKNKNSKNEENVTEQNVNVKKEDIKNKEIPQEEEPKSNETSTISKTADKSSTEEINLVTKTSISLAQSTENLNLTSTEDLSIISGSQLDTAGNFEISPTTKRRSKKLNDCIARLTGKLQEKMGKQFVDDKFEKDDISGSCTSISNLDTEKNIITGQNELDVIDSNVIPSTKCDKIIIPANNLNLDFKQVEEDSTKNQEIHEIVNKSSTKRKSATRKFIKTDDLKEVHETVGLNLDRTEKNVTKVVSEISKSLENIKEISKNIQETLQKPVSSSCSNLSSLSIEIPKIQVQQQSSSRRRCRAKSSSQLQPPAPQEIPPINIQVFNDIIKPPKFEPSAKPFQLKVPELFTSIIQKNEIILQKGNKLSEDLIISPILQSPNLKSPILQSPILQSPILQSPILQSLSPSIQTHFMENNINSIILTQPHPQQQRPPTSTPRKTLTPAQKKSLPGMPLPPQQQSPIIPQPQTSQPVEQYAIDLSISQQRLTEATLLSFMDFDDDAPLDLSKKSTTAPSSTASTPNMPRRSGFVTKPNENTMNRVQGSENVTLSVKPIEMLTMPTINNLPIRIPTVSNPSVKNLTSLLLSSPPLGFNEELLKNKLFELTAQRNMTELNIPNTSNLSIVTTKKKKSSTTSSYGSSSSVRPQSFRNQNLSDSIDDTITAVILGLDSQSINRKILPEISVPDNSAPFFTLPNLVAAVEKPITNDFMVTQEKPPPPLLIEKVQETPPPVNEKPVEKQLLPATESEVIVVPTEVKSSISSTLLPPSNNIAKPADEEEDIEILITKLSHIPPKIDSTNLDNVQSNEIGSTNAPGKSVKRKPTRKKKTTAANVDIETKTVDVVSDKVEETQIETINSSSNEVKSTTTEFNEADSSKSNDNKITKNIRKSNQKLENVEQKNELNSNINIVEKNSSLVPRTSQKETSEEHPESINDVDSTENSDICISVTKKTKKGVGNKDMDLEISDLVSKRNIASQEAQIPAEKEPDIIENLSKKTVKATKSNRKSQVIPKNNTDVKSTVEIVKSTDFTEIRSNDNTAKIAPKIIENTVLNDTNQNNITKEKIIVDSQSEITNNKVMTSIVNEPKKTIENKSKSKKSAKQTDKIIIPEKTDDTDLNNSLDIVPKKITRNSPQQQHQKEISPPNPTAKTNKKGSRKSGKSSDIIEEEKEEEKKQEKELISRKGSKKNQADSVKIKTITESQPEEKIKEKINKTSSKNKKITVNEQEINNESINIADEKNGNLPILAKKPHSKQVTKSKEVQSIVKLPENDKNKTKQMSSGELDSTKDAIDSTENAVTKTTQKVKKLSRADAEVIENSFKSIQSISNLNHSSNKNDNNNSTTVTKAERKSFNDKSISLDSETNLTTLGGTRRSGRNKQQDLIPVRKEVEAIVASFLSDNDDDDDDEDNEPLARTITKQSSEKLAAENKQNITAKALVSTTEPVRNESEKKPENPAEISVETPRKRGRPRLVIKNKSPEKKSELIVDTLVVEVNLKKNKKTKLMLNENIEFEVPKITDLITTNKKQPRIRKSLTTSPPAEKENCSETILNLIEENTNSTKSTQQTNDENQDLMMKQLENIEDIRPDSVTKKQRRRRRNELAAIVADQLLESFKEVDKSRIDDLKMLENLAYEKSEDLLLTGMRLTPTTKRKNSLAENKEIAANKEIARVEQNKQQQQLKIANKCKNNKNEKSDKTLPLLLDNEPISDFSVETKKRKTITPELVIPPVSIKQNEQLLPKLIKPNVNEPFKSSINNDTHVPPSELFIKSTSGSNLISSQFETNLKNSSFDKCRPIKEFDFMMTGRSGGQIPAASDSKSNKETTSTSGTSTSDSNNQFIPIMIETSNSVDSIKPNSENNDKSKNNVLKKGKKKLIKKKERKMEMENINELRSGLESFTFGKGQFVDFVPQIFGGGSSKCFSAFTQLKEKSDIVAKSHFTNSTVVDSSVVVDLTDADADDLILKKFETAQNFVPIKKPILRPSILAVSLETAAAISKPIIENTLISTTMEINKSVSSRDPRLNKNIQVTKTDDDLFEKRSIRSRRKSENNLLNRYQPPNNESDCEELSTAFNGSRELRPTRTSRRLNSSRENTNSRFKAIGNDSSSDDDNYLAEIAKSVKEKIRGCEDEDFNLANDGFELAKSFLNDERIPRPSTSLSMRSAPNLLDDRNNDFDEDENTNTELIDMDLDDDCSVYTSFSQDVRRKGRRRRRRSVLMARRRTSRASSVAAVDTNEIFECQLCNKNFKKMAALTKHKMTLAHVSKVSAHEYYNLDATRKQKAEEEEEQIKRENIEKENAKRKQEEEKRREAEMELEKEKQRVAELDLLKLKKKMEMELIERTEKERQRKLEMAELAELAAKKENLNKTPPTKVVLTQKPVELAEENIVPPIQELNKDDISIQNELSNTENLVESSSSSCSSSSSSESSSDIEDITENQMPFKSLETQNSSTSKRIEKPKSITLSALLNQEGIEPISSPEQNYDRYPATTTTSSSRLALNPEERLFYECCNMLKGSETPMIERSYPIIPHTTYANFDSPTTTKPITPKSSEKFSYPEGNFQHGTAFTVKSPMSQSRTSPRHAYPKIDVNQFSDISSDSNSGFPRSQPPQNLPVMTFGQSHKFSLFNQSPVRDVEPNEIGSAADNIGFHNKNIKNLDGRSSSSHHIDTGESSFTPAPGFPADMDAASSISLTARTFISSNQTKVPSSNNGSSNLLDLNNTGGQHQQQTFTSPAHSTSSQGSNQTTTTTCRMKTKAAMKGYDNFKVSIPTIGLDMQQVLQRSPQNNGCKLTALAEIALCNEPPPAIANSTTKSKTSTTGKIKSKTNTTTVEHARKSKEFSSKISIKNLDDKTSTTTTAGKLGFKAKKNQPKVLPGNKPQTKQEMRTETQQIKVAKEVDDDSPFTENVMQRKDIYDFDESEETKGKGSGRKQQLPLPKTPITEDKIIIPERPFKNIGMNNEQNQIHFQKPEEVIEKSPISLKDNEESVVSTTTYSDRDDFNYASMTDNNDDEDLADNNVEDESSSDDSAVTSKTLGNKSLIMGRIFKKATTTTNPVEERKPTTAAAINTTILPAEPKKKKLPKQELDKLFDQLISADKKNENVVETGSKKVKSTVVGSKATTEIVKGTASHESEKTVEIVIKKRGRPRKIENQTNNSTTTEQNKCRENVSVKNTELTKSIEKLKHGQKDFIKPATTHQQSPPKVKKDQPSTTTSKKTSGQGPTKQIAKLQSELGMSAEDVAELIGDGQRKSTRRCAANQQKKHVEIWSSDEYEEFLTTKDIIALIEEKEKKVQKKKKDDKQLQQVVLSKKSTIIKTMNSADSPKLKKIDEIIKLNKSEHVEEQHNKIRSVKDLLNEKKLLEKTEKVSKPKLHVLHQHKDDPIKKLTEQKNQNLTALTEQQHNDFYTRKTVNQTEKISKNKQDLEQFKELKSNKFEIKQMTTEEEQKEFLEMSLAKIQMNLNSNFSDINPPASLFPKPTTTKIVDKLLEKIASTKSALAKSQQSMLSSSPATLPAKHSKESPVIIATQNINEEKNLKMDKKIISNNSKKPLPTLKPRLKARVSDSESDFEAELKGKASTSGGGIRKRRKTITSKEDHIALSAPPAKRSFIQTTASTDNLNTKKLNTEKDKKSLISKSAKKSTATVRTAGKSIDRKQTLQNRALSRRKRVASEKLYYWSSSSDEEFGLIENHEEDEDDLTEDGERLQQHGWIVGDSHKKLVTLLAIAKGNKKVDDCGVKETNSKKKTT